MIDFSIKELRFLQCLLYDETTTQAMNDTETTKYEFASLSMKLAREIKKEERLAKATGADQERIGSRCGSCIDTLYNDLKYSSETRGGKKNVTGTSDDNA